MIVFIKNHIKFNKIKLILTSYLKNNKQKWKFNLKTMNINYKIYKNKVLKNNLYIQK